MKEHPPVLSQSAEDLLSLYILSQERMRITSNGVYMMINTPAKKRIRRKMSKNKSL